MAGQQEDWEGLWTLMAGAMQPVPFDPLTPKIDELKQAEKSMEFFNRPKPKELQDMTKDMENNDMMFPRPKERNVNQQKEWEDLWNKVNPPKFQGEMDEKQFRNQMGPEPAAPPGFQREMGPQTPMSTADIIHDATQRFKSGEITKEQFIDLLDYYAPMNARKPTTPEVVPLPRSRPSGR